MGMKAINTSMASASTTANYYCSQLNEELRDRARFVFSGLRTAATAPINTFASCLLMSSTPIVLPFVLCVMTILIACTHNSKYNNNNPIAASQPSSLVSFIASSSSFYFTPLGDTSEENSNAVVSEANLSGIIPNCPNTKQREEEALPLPLLASSHVLNYFSPYLKLAAINTSATPHTATPASVETSLPSHHLFSASILTVLYERVLFHQSLFQHYSC